MAELAAGNASRETVVTDSNLLVYEFVGEIIRALGHGTNKDANALRWFKVLDIVSRSHDLFVKTEGNLAAVRREMVCDGVLNDAQQLLLRVCGSDGQTVEKLNHQTSKTFEGPGNSNGWGNLNENALRSVDVDLQLASLVDRGIEKGKQALCQYGTVSMLNADLIRRRLVRQPQSQEV